MFILYFVKQVWANKSMEIYGNPWKCMIYTKKSPQRLAFYSGIIQHFHPRRNLLF